MSRQYGSNADPVSDLKDQATDQVKKVADRVEGLAGSATQQAKQVADRAGEAAEQVGDVASNVKGAVDKSLKQQPMATLAIAAMLGFVLGALWKSYALGAAKG
jgi:ElaB/YqjD/DUF883 family membrane-anchored ribosome-binding protein